MALKNAQGTVRLIDKATEPLRNIAKAFKSLGSASKNTNKDLNNTQKAINSLTSAQNRLNRTQAGIDRRTRGIQGEAVGIAALALSFKQALDPAIKFEQSMKDLEAVAFGSADATVDVRANMALLSDQAKKLGQTTRYSATQAAEGQLYLAKAGFKTNEILAAMSPLLSLAAASDTELGRASDITSDLLGAFGMKASETAKLADVLAAATSSANVDMETLFETLKEAAPIGIAAGQSMESMVTAASILGNVGIKGGRAGTAIKNALVNLASPAANGAKVLKELGITTSDATGNMLSMQEILINLGKESKNLNQVKRMEAFAAIFGREALSGAVNLEKAVNSGDFAKMLTNLEKSEGVAKRMADIRMDSTQGSLVELGSAIEGVVITFGNMLIPILRVVAKTLTALTEPLQQLMKENETLIKLVGVFAGVLLTAKVAGLAYTASLWLISPALTALKIALGGAKLAMIAFNFALNANPIGLIIAGVASLIALGVTLYQNWEKITNVFKNFKDTIKGIATNIGLDNLFGGEIKQNISQTPAQAVAQVRNNNINNNEANITVNVQDGKVRSIENQGNFKTNVFLNNGVQQ